MFVIVYIGFIWYLLINVYIRIEWRPVCVHAIWTRLVTRHIHEALGLARFLVSLQASVGQIWVFLRACLLRWWATHRHVHIQDRNTTKKTMTCHCWYRHSQRLGRSQVYTELSSHVSVTYLVGFIFHLYTSII